jgi:Zn-dependent M28 family amino/carboxypeptidase
VEGKFPVRNIIAKFPGTKDGIIVILGHYDTNYPLRNIGYVGANDGGSSTAILLEFANQLRVGVKSPAKSAMATASGWSGPTAKKR